jgi:hypothetical protein
MNYSLVGWIKYDEKQDRGHGEGDKLTSSVWDALLSRKRVALRKCMRVFLGIWSKYVATFVISCSLHAYSTKKMSRKLIAELE